MDFQQLRIYDFLYIALLVIFMATASVIFLYYTWSAIDFGIAKCKKSLQKRGGDKIEGLFTTSIAAIEMDSKNHSVSMEFSHETADEEEDVYFDCYV